MRLIKPPVWVFKAQIQGPASVSLAQNSEREASTSRKVRRMCENTRTKMHGNLQGTYVSRSPIAAR
jgi:hypothetical protein